MQKYKLILKPPNILRFFSKNYSNYPNTAFAYFFPNIVGSKKSIIAAASNITTFFITVIVLELILFGAKVRNIFETTKFYGEKFLRSNLHLFIYIVVPPARPRRR